MQDRSPPTAPPAARPARRRSTGERSVLTSILRGARPHLSGVRQAASLFRRYLKVADNCPNCGEALHHHRADDAPPYFTIIIVGHIVVGLMLAVEMAYRPPLWLHAVLWLPLTVLLALLILPPIKGALVGLQWALLMHGFDPDAKEETIEGLDETIGRNLIRLTGARTA